MKGSVFCSAKARLKLEEGVGEVLGGGRQVLLCLGRSLGMAEGRAGPLRTASLPSPLPPGPHAPTLPHAPDFLGEGDWAGLCLRRKAYCCSASPGRRDTRMQGRCRCWGRRGGLTTASWRRSWAQLDKVNGEDRPVRTVLEAWGRGCLVAWPCTRRLGQGNRLVEWAWAG